VAVHRFLIVNADDFGRTRGITQGILQAHREGIVTSTTVMVNFPEAEAAVQRAVATAPALGIGIHLTLTAGGPVLPPEQVPSLVDSRGRFPPIRRLIPRLSSLDLSEVEAELTAQIERFRSWGVRPTHLDSHHHLLYLSPDLFQLLVRLAQRYRLPIRYPWPRRATAPEELAHLAEAHRLPSDALPSLIAACNAILEDAGLPVPDRCILSFYDEGATLQHLLDLIAGLPEGISELMCHPGQADAELAAQSGYVLGRQRELTVLTHPRVLKALGPGGVRLTDFRVLAPDLPSHRRAREAVEETGDEEREPQADVDGEGDGEGRAQD